MTKPCHNENKDMIRHAGNSIFWHLVHIPTHVPRGIWPPTPTASNPTTGRNNHGALPPARSRTPMAQSGWWPSTFGAGLRLWVPVRPYLGGFPLILYPTLEEAAAALGSDFVAVPGVSSKTYIGTVIQAVRVSITGQTARPIDNAGNLGEFTLTETVEFRR